MYTYLHKVCKGNLVCSEIPNYIFANLDVEKLRNTDFISDPNMKRINRLILADYYAVLSPRISFNVYLVLNEM
jgi:hypothetical protein